MWLALARRWGLLLALVLSFAEARAEEKPAEPDPSEPLISEEQLLRLGVKDLTALDFSVPIKLFNERCGVCHGMDLSGSAQGGPLVGKPLRGGNTVEEIAKSISTGNPGKGMPAWAEVLDEGQIRSLAIYIVEQRFGFKPGDVAANQPLTLPDGPVETKLHTYRMETHAEGLDSMPFAIAALPDGDLLVSEKRIGLRIVSPDGTVSPLIKNAPLAYNDDEHLISAQNESLGLGWMLDIKPHPDYAKNGWIYILHGDRCQNCNDLSKEKGLPVSMSRLVRGRIRDGEWVNEQVIWRNDIDHYTPISDGTGGGRIAFDDSGHVYITTGLKGGYTSGQQSWESPYGKIHRVRDDGEIPPDNPFVNVPGAMKSVWAKGFRNPQGLEFDPAQGQLWSSDHGPRGGDELNLIIKGGNYGWPLTSLGMNYNGKPVNYGPEIGVEWTLDEIEQPAVDFTPSPAVSNLTIYHGDLFPRWKGNVLLGTLKARTLYRIAFEDGKMVEKEVLFKDLNRVRDVEVGPKGEIYILFENTAGGRIIRMVPADAPGGGNLAAR